jgi:hypothetical protein
LQANQEQPVYLLSDSSDTDLDTAKKVKKMNKATGGGTKPRKNKEPTAAAATGDLNKKKKKKGEEGVRRARIIHTDKAKRGPRLEAPTTPKVGVFQPPVIKT